MIKWAKGEFNALPVCGIWNETKGYIRGGKAKENQGFPPFPFVRAIQGNEAILPLFCPLGLNDLEVPDLVVITLFELFGDMQIDPPSYTTILMAETPGDCINSHSVCKQQGSVCMPERVSGQLPAEHFRRYLFKIFVVAVVIDAATVFIREKQVRSVAQKDAFFPDKDIDLPAKLK